MINCIEKIIGERLQDISVRDRFETIQNAREKNDNK